MGQERDELCRALPDVRARSARSRHQAADIVLSTALLDLAETGVLMSA